MLSKNKIKVIQSLSLKKYRDETHLFVAEGFKTIKEFAQAKFKFEYIVCTQEMENLAKNVPCEKIIATNEEIKKASSLNTPQQMLAIIHKKETPFDTTTYTNDLVIALDEIQDPGNLGTIIRLCSWFGINNLICSLNSADCYNPKAVQASMGAIAHVNISYTELKPFLEQAKLQGVPIFGTFLEGNSIYKEKLSSNGIIIMGNEGKGISDEVAPFVTNKLFIPSFNRTSNCIESLNVSTATSIICSEFRRRFS
jgi:RNA methyltransferase, TrmH family